MNYTVYKALNNLANGTTTFNTTITAVGNAINAVNSAANLTNTQDILAQIEGGYNGWTNNITTLGDGAWAAAYPNLTGSSPIGFTQTNEWKYIQANTSVSAQALKAGDVTVTGSGN